MKPLNRIAIFACLFLLGYAPSYAQNRFSTQRQPSQVRPRPEQPQKVNVLLNGSYLIRAKNYQVYEFSFDQAYGFGQIGGRISVQGPANFQIQAWILDNHNLENFTNRQEFNSFLTTGRVRLKSFSVTLNPGRYYLVLDNRFSAINDKSVFAQVAVRQFPAPRASRPTPPDKRIDDKADDQVPYAARGGYAVASYRSRRIIRLKKMLDQVIYDECCLSKVNSSGIIAEVVYKQEDLLSFTLKLPSG